MPDHTDCTGPTWQHDELGRTDQEEISLERSTDHEVISDDLSEIRNEYCLQW